jgi:hypothetical protein
MFGKPRKNGSRTNMKARGWNLSRWIDVILTLGCQTQW